MRRLHKARRRGKVIGFASTVGDVLHAGHIAMLEESAQQCEFLVVAFIIDPTADRPKKNKPIQSSLERYIQLSALAFVDMVIPCDNEQDLYDAILLVRPQVRTVGSDYIGQDFTGKELCKVYYCDREHSFSSTELRKRIKEA